MPAPPTPRELFAGQIVDQKYQIVELLGQGGMGRVYQARRLTLGDDVAIKCILPERNNPTNRERFLREARAVARIRHPHVVQVFDFGELDQEGTPYMVMERLEGPTLADVIAQGIPPAEQARSIFGQICAAIEAGHRRGVVHRDIKPGNVILARTDDGGETVKVLDFGLAQLTTGEASVPQFLVGTVEYMSPEQVRGDAVSPASDVFSLSVVLYELFTGRRPFSGESTINTLFRISQGQRHPLEATVPEDVAAAIEQGLQLEPAQRPRSALALAQLAGASAARLEPVAHGSGPGRPTTTRSGTDIQSARPVMAASSSLVGRSGELTALDEELAGAGRGEARVVLIEGDTGSGKTRLLDEAATRMATVGASVVRGRYFAYAADRPPPGDVLTWVMRSPGPTPTGDATIDSATPGLEAPPEPSRSDKWQLFEKTATDLLEHAGTRPLVVLLDDLQWAGTLDLELLSYLRFRARGRSLLLVASTRPHPSPELRAWAAKIASARALRRLVLEPLSSRDTQAYLRFAFSPLRIAPQDVRRIHHVTSGNPYALVELSRQLVEKGRLRLRDDEWICDDLFDVGLPDSIQTMVQAQLDELPPDTRDLLELCCVVGEELRFDTVLAASGLSEDEVEARLEQAVERRVLVEPEGRTAGADYRFASAALRQVLYESLAPRKRRRRHRQVVEALRAQPDPRGRLAEVLVVHYRAMEDWPQALTHGLEAAARALAIHDADAAEVALQAATEALGHVEATPAELARHAYLSGRRDVRLGRFDAAATALPRAASLAHELGDEVLALDATLELAEGELGRGRFEACIDWATQAIECAQRLGDVSRELHGRIHFAQAAGPMGRIPEALTTIAPVLAATGERFALHRALAGRERAWLLAKIGEFGPAQAAARAAVEEARVARDALAQYRAQSALGLVLAEWGDHSAAIEQLEHALELARGLSLRRREGIELCNIGECLLLSGDAPRALDLTRQGLAIFVEIGDTASEGDCRVNLGRMLRNLGRRDEAIEMLDRGRQACAASGRIEYEAVALVELADLHAAEGHVLLARALYARAAERYAAIGASQRWQAVYGVARMDAALGDATQARTKGEEALAQVRSQLTAVPRGVDPASLRRSSSEISRFLASPVGTTVVDDLEPDVDRRSLDHQHRSLQGAAQAILAQACELHDPEVSRTLHGRLLRFRQELREHADTETSGAYLRLLRHRDPAIRERVTDLYTQGLGLYEAFFAFLARWEDPASIEAKRGAFAEELVSVMGRLYKRMRIEEHELHPLIEAELRPAP